MERLPYELSRKCLSFVAIEVCKFLRVSRMWNATINEYLTENPCLRSPMDLTLKLNKIDSKLREKLAMSKYFPHSIILNEEKDMDKLQRIVKRARRIQTQALTILPIASNVQTLEITRNIPQELFFLLKDLPRLESAVLPFACAKEISLNVKKLCITNHGETKINLERPNGEWPFLERLQLVGFSLKNYFPSVPKQVLTTCSILGTPPDTWHACIVELHNTFVPNGLVFPNLQRWDDRAGRISVPNELVRLTRLTLSVKTFTLLACSRDPFNSLTKLDLYGIPLDSASHNMHGIPGDTVSQSCIRKMAPNLTHLRLHVKPNSYVQMRNLQRLRVDSVHPTSFAGFPEFFPNLKSISFHPFCPQARQAFANTTTKTWNPSIESPHRCFARCVPCLIHEHKLDADKPVVLVVHVGANGIRIIQETMDELSCRLLSAVVHRTTNAEQESVIAAYLESTYKSIPADKCFRAHDLLNGASGFVVKRVMTCDRGIVPILEELSVLPSDTQSNRTHNADGFWPRRKWRELFYTFP
jgi:hypothetical protein